LHHPRVYERVTSEIRAAFPATSRPIPYAEARQRLPYLTAVVYESMRLNPAVSGMLPRSAPWDGATIQGKFIPSRTQICVSIDACHRNPRTWPNPDAFDPERFLGENAEVRMKDIIAFSSGVRVCIGRNLAWMQIYSVLANILRKYDFALPTDAAYGPHRTNSEGVPVAIPAVSFIVTGPANPKRDCLVNISAY
ncbi:cytochrome P450, partial [Linderina pennispora]